MFNLKIGVLLVKNGKLLLTKEWSNKRKGFYLNIITGKFEPEKDKSLINCAKREAKEELGIKISPRHIVEMRIIHADDSIGVAFLAEIEKGVPKIMEKENMKKTTWISKEEIDDLNPDQFVSANIYKLINKWKSGKHYPLEIIENVQSLK